MEEESCVKQILRDKPEGKRDLRRPLHCWTDQFIKIWCWNNTSRDLLSDNEKERKL
jgi:hypothetical protein